MFGMQRKPAGAIPLWLESAPAGYRGGANGRRRPHPGCVALGLRKSTHNLERLDDPAEGVDVGIAQELADDPDEE